MHFDPPIVPLFGRVAVPSLVRCCTVLLLCFLIVGIHASGISMPLSLLMLLGWSLMRIASLTLRVYQWGSRSINLTSFQIRLHPNNINRHSGIEIPEAWIPTIKKHNRRTVQQWTTEGTATRPNNGTIGGSKCTNHSQPLWYKWYRAISRPYRLKKTSSKQLKRRDLHLKWLHRETNNNTLYYCIYHDE